MIKKILNNRLHPIVYGIIWVFLSCYFMQLFNFPNRWTILIGGTVCLFLLIKQKKIRIDVELLLLILTMASYFIIMHGKRAFAMLLPYVGVLIYVLGNYLTCEIIGDEKSERRLTLLLLTIAVGYSLHGIINSILFMDGQIQENNIRVWMDIWENWYLPGTWQVIFFLPALSMVFPALIYFKKWKIKSVLVFLVSILFSYIALASQTRTPILAFPIIFCAQICLYIILEREKIKELVRRKDIQLKLAIFLIAMVLLGLVLLNHPLVKSFISIMGRDGGILNNVRFKVHREGLRQLFVYPMGGNQMDFLGPVHAHNTWIDIADASGIIPFFSFAVYTLITVVELIVWLTKKEISTERKLMTAGIYGIFFLYYTIERALGGSMHYMTPWFLVNSMVHGELGVMRKKSI